MNKLEQPVQKITREQLALVDSFFELPLVMDITELYSIITPDTQSAISAIDSKDYDFTKLILNSDRDKRLINTIKDPNTGIFKQLKNNKRLLEKGDKDNDLEIRLRYEKLLDIEEGCKCIRLIMQIKYFTTKNDGNAVAKLSDELSKSYERIYDRIDNSWIKQVVNSENMRSLFEKCKLENPELWVKISPKIEPHLEDRRINSEPNISEFKQLSDIFISKKLDIFCPDVLIEIGDGKEMVDSNFMVEQVQIAIDNIYKVLEFEPTGSSKWTVRLRTEDPEKTTFSAEQSTKEVIIPIKSQSISQFKAVLYHEVFIHALRQINSERLGLQSMLPDYIVFEEGLASVVQSIVENKETIPFGKSNTPKLIALNQLGLDTDEILDLYSVKLKSDKQQKILKNNAIRMLRGGSGIKNALGLNTIYPKDIAYSLGAQKVYRLVQIINDSETNLELKNAISKIFEQLSSCKFDAMNQLHIRYLISRNILKFSPEESSAYLKFISI
jgi:hypothetical protein